MDKEVLLAIINGPGPGLTFMVLGLIASFVTIYCVKLGQRRDFEEGKKAARREGLENLQVTLAKLVHEQSEMKQQIAKPNLSQAFPDDSDYRGGVR